MTKFYCRSGKRKVLLLAYSYDDAASRFIRFVQRSQNRVIGNYIYVSQRGFGLFRFRREGHLFVSRDVIAAVIGA